MGSVREPERRCLRAATGNARARSDPTLRQPLGHWTVAHRPPAPSGPAAKHRLVRFACRTSFPRSRFYQNSSSIKVSMRSTAVPDINFGLKAPRCLASCSRSIPDVLNSPAALVTKIEFQQSCSLGQPMLAPFTQQGTKSLPVKRPYVRQEAGAELPSADLVLR